MPGWKTASEITALDRSRRLFIRNAEEVRQFLDDNSEPPRVFELLSPENRDDFEKFLDEVDRLLHNFVAAAMSLRDHSLRVKAKLLPASDGDRLSEEYKTRSAVTFDEPLPSFVQDLRHYSLHRRLPVTSGRASMRRVSAGPEFEFESQIVLHPSDLLRWSKWTAASRSFIDSAGKYIAIDEVVSAYTALVLSFHDWFREALMGRHHASLTELKSEATELERRWREEIRLPVEDAS